MTKYMFMEKQVKNSENGKNKIKKLNFQKV